MRKITIILLTLFVLNAGCRFSPNGHSDERIYKIATLNGPSSIGMIKLIDSLRSSSETEISIDILNEPMQVRKMMLEDEAEFAVLPTTMAALLYNKGMDYVMVAVPVWGSLYLLGSDTTINNWEALRGRNINIMGRGMTPDILFRYLLKNYNIDPDKDVVLDYSFPTHIEMANALAAGQVETGVVSEPQSSLVLNRNKNVHLIFDLNKEWEKLEGYPMTQTALLVKRSVIEENPKLIKKIMKACENSTLWVNQNPDAAAHLIVKYGILPDYQTAVDAIPRSNLSFSRASGIKEMIGKYLKHFYDIDPDIIGGKIPDEKFYY
ncbi:MAG: ABC transporter substrate-binding protein [Bacteroidales bacterium]